MPHRPSGTVVDTPLGYTDVPYASSSNLEEGIRIPQYPSASSNATAMIKYPSDVA